MKSGMAVRIVGLVGVLLALASCEGVRKELGLNKQSPDEFKVVSRAPLTLPPDFNLRPPQPGMVRPQEGSPTEQARQAVFRNETQKAASLDTAAPPEGRSVGEQSLLKALGAEKADPNIRLVVNRETAELNAADEDFVSLLVFWQDKVQPGVIVDADAEAKRLRENAALGKSVTAGETPQIERRRRAPLEGIF